MVIYWAMATRRTVDTITTLVEWTMPVQTGSFSR
jgi:hypothetical protein